MITRCLQGNWAPSPSLAEGDTQWFALKPDKPCSEMLLWHKMPSVPLFSPRKHVGKGGESAA